MEATLFSVDLAAITPVSELRTSGVQSIGTTEESLVLGDVTSIGWVVIRNLDATNFVRIEQQLASLE